LLEPTAGPSLPASLRPLPERCVHAGTGIVLVRVPAGRYMRGSPADEPLRDTDERAHEVVLAHEFWLGETEVTVGQWELVMGADFEAPALDPALPASDVTWYEAEEFVRRLNELGPPGWRMPREDEWEYACRAGTTTPFAFGDDIRPELVNYNAYYPYRPGPRGERSDGPKPVRSLPPNAWGFHEMHGNVVEWCSDVYTAEPGPTPAPEGASRVLRGGSYVASADQVRSAWREGYPPKSDGREYGLRVAWSPPGAR
jgi:formylglycine-generating enzyme required for sulfatase activity